jgi:hypothetical protein
MTVKSRPERVPSRDESGAIPWLELANGATRDALVERLAQAHLVDDGQPSTDVDGLLGPRRDQELPEA